MKPLDQMSPEDCARIRVVLTDIDETLTTDGHLTADAYGALERLKQAGFIVVPITGRPAGWCDHIARMWPVDAVVGENGAFYFRYDHTARVFTKRFQDSDDARAGNRQRLADLRESILAAVPGAGIASDQTYREADLAIDFCEDVPPLPREDIDRIVSLFKDAGATAKVSSIHINGWFGKYDKLSMARIALLECFGLDVEKDGGSCLYIGDSPNDAPMFAFFDNAVGVANVKLFVDQMDALPTYITRASSGAGFAECAEWLCNGKR